MDETSTLQLWGDTHGHSVKPGSPMRQIWLRQNRSESQLATLPQHGQLATLPQHGQLATKKKKKKNGQLATLPQIGHF